MRKIFKYFINFEKEEQWLNEMARNGFALKEKSIFYMFDECDPGEYIFRIEQLPDEQESLPSREYLEFMHEHGLEAATSYGRWVYFKKKASDGPFKIYSDIDTMIAYQRKVLRNWFLTNAGALLACLGLILNYIGNHQESKTLSTLIIILFILYIAIYYRIVIRTFKLWINYRRLKRERAVVE